MGYGEVLRFHRPHDPVPRANKKKFPEAAHGDRFLCARRTAHSASREVLRPSNPQLREIHFGRMPAVMQFRAWNAMGAHGKISYSGSRISLRTAPGRPLTRMVGETEGELKGKLVEAGKNVGEEVSRLKCKLSEKSTLVPENKTTKAVVKILNATGIPMKTANTCDDVGVQMSGSLIRRASTLNARISKGSKRALRTADLVKINPAAKKLTMSGTAKVQPYGHQALGACMTQQFAMRSSIKKTTPSAGSWACTATVIAFTLGPTDDPLIKIPLEQIDSWFQV